MRKHEEIPHRAWPYAWTLVFACNLIVPLSLAWQMSEHAGRIGIGLAIVVYWMIGLVTCADGGRRGGRPLVAGGIWVALSQLLPIAQILAGLAGVWSWAAISGQEHRPLSVLGGFTMTIVTGGLLLTLAEVIGLIAYAISGHPSHPPRAKKPGMGELSVRFNSCLAARSAEHGRQAE